MKKIVMLVLMAVLLSGCGMSHARYTRLVERCESLGGTPIVFKTREGFVTLVRCQVGDVTFPQGDY